MHARKQIRDAFVTAITGGSATVFNGRVFPLYDTVLPAYCVYSREESIQEERTERNLQIRTLIVTIQIYAKYDEALDDNLDALSEEIETMVFGNVALGNLIACRDLTTTEIEVSQEGEKEIGIMTLSFSCKYSTNDGNPGVIL